MGGGDLPAQGHQGLAIGLIQRLAIQCRDKVWPNLGGAGQRFVAAKTVHLAVVAGEKDIWNYDVQRNYSHFEKMPNGVAILNYTAKAEAVRNV